MRIKIYSYVTPGYDDMVRDGRAYIQIPEEITSRFSNTRMIARMAKCLPHMFMDPDEYDACLWVDSNVQLKKGNSYEQLIRNYFAKSEHCSVFAHTQRTTINEEIDAIDKFGLDHPTLTKKHRDKEGTLAWTGILYRKFTPEVIRANNYWWSELSTKSSRDQLTFPYCFDGLVDYKENPDLEKLGELCWTNNSIWGKLKHKKKQDF